MSSPTTQAQSTSTTLNSTSTLSAEFRALNTDYLMLVSTTLICPDQERYWRGLCAGTYRLVSRSGRSHQATINHPRERIHPSGEYLTLLAGLSDLLKRIRAAGREPNAFTLAIFSGQELVVQQLAGTYQVKSAILKPLYTQARGMLDQFRGTEVAWKPGALLKKELE